MKKIVLFSSLLLLSAATFSQQTTTTAPITKADYLKKSKNQKRTALLFLGTGGLCIMSPFLLPKGKKITYDTGGSLWGVPIVSSYYKNDGLKGTLFLTGILASLSSIPIFLACHRNKKKSMRLSFENQTIPLLSNQNFVYKAVPSLSFKISL